VSLEVTSKKRQSDLQSVVRCLVSMLGVVGRGMSGTVVAMRLQQCVTQSKACCR